MADKKWKYSFGIHQGTTVSRDLGEPKFFETEQECKEYHLDNRNWMRSIGYQIWFATITSPNGKKTQIESSPYGEW